MTFTERIEKLLGANHLKDVIDEFLKFLNDVPQSDRDARSDANQLRGQIIILSGRFTELNNRQNTSTIDSATANQEKAVLINSFIQILNQLPSSYPDLYVYLEEKNEEDEWKEAHRKNSIEGYQFYFSKYPNGKYKADTIKLIGELEEVKLRQDNEIKRLASLEKERRDNDRVESESKRSDTTETSERAYRPASVMGSAPAKSRKGLYIALGIVIGIIFIIILAVMVSPQEASETVTNPVPIQEETSNQDSTVMSLTSTEKPAAAVSTEQPMEAPKEKKPEGITEAIKAELISAIRLADDAEANANYALDTRMLHKSFTGEALKSEIASVQQLIADGFNINSTLEQQKFNSFTLSEDGQQAAVKLTETWSSMYITTATNTCYGKIPSHTLPQTMHLIKTENGWLVFSIIQEKLKQPDMLPCD